MIPTQLLFLTFILIIFVILTLIALNIDLLNRFFSRKVSWEFRRTPLHETTIKDINHQINSCVLSENLAKKLIRICPVEAITLIAEPEIHLLVLENRCLGYACLECLRLIRSE